MRRHVWDCLFDEIAVSVSKIMFGDDCSNSVLQNVLKNAMRAQRIDQNLRCSIEAEVSVQVDKELQLLRYNRNRVTDADVASFRCRILNHVNALKSEDPNQIKNVVSLLLSEAANLIVKSRLEEKRKAEEEK